MKYGIHLPRYVSVGIHISEDCMTKSFKWSVLNIQGDNGCECPLCPLECHYSKCHIAFFTMIFWTLHILNILFGADNFMYQCAALKWRCDQTLRDKLTWQMLGTSIKSAWRKRVWKSGRYCEVFCKVQNPCSF